MTYRVITNSSFVPFGSNQGDTLLTFGDDNLSSQVPISSIKFYGFYFSSLFVATNGYLSFGLFSGYCGGFPALGQAVIAAFKTDLFASISAGRVYYRSTTSPSILALFSYPNILPISPTYAFIATWDNVVPCCTSSASSTVSFQIVLATDGTSTYVIFQYGLLMFSGPCAAVAGFNKGDGTTSFSLPNSKTSLSQTFASNSNVGNAGKWVFRVDGAII
jgi:hypothetical protein